VETSCELEEGAVKNLARDLARELARELALVELMSENWDFYPSLHFQLEAVFHVDPRAFLLESLDSTDEMLGSDPRLNLVEYDEKPPQNKEKCVEIALFGRAMDFAGSLAPGRIYELGKDIGEWLSFESHFSSEEKSSVFHSGVVVLEVKLR